MLKRTKLLIICFALTASSALHAQDSFMGEIKMFAGNFAPQGWAFCDGQLLPINQYQALFSILGTTYGGNGVQTFALPDLRGRVAINEGRGQSMQGMYTLGQQSGYELTVLNSSNLPPHQLNVPALQVDLKAANTNLTIGNKSVLTTGNTPNASIATAPIGAAAPISNMQPYLVVHYIIRISGTVPLRSN